MSGIKRRTGFNAWVEALPAANGQDQCLKASFTFSPASLRSDLAWSFLPSFSVDLSP